MKRALCWLAWLLGFGGHDFEIINTEWWDAGTSPDVRCRKCGLYR